MWNQQKFHLSYKIRVTEMAGTFEPDAAMYTLPIF